MRIANKRKWRERIQIACVIIVVWFIISILFNILAYTFPEQNCYTQDSIGYMFGVFTCKYHPLSAEVIKKLDEAKCKSRIFDRCRLGSSSVYTPNATEHHIDCWNKNVSKCG